MKRTFFSLLLGAAALIAPQTASATLLVGFHDFETNTANEDADYALASFSGNVIKNGEASVTGGGSTDGLYGNSIASEFPGLNPGTNDGYLRSLNAGAPVIRLTNNSAGTYNLASLLFDAASQAGGATINVQVRTNAAPSFASLGSSGPTVSSPSAGVDYSDFVLSLMGFALSAGDWIEFRFNASPNGRLDNIAITGTLSAIPEPGSLIALGCLVGSGAFLRTRRRKVLAGVA